MDASVTIAAVPVLAAVALAGLWRREMAGRASADSGRAVMAEIVEALPGGFVAWDADDRLVMHDAEFVRVSSRIGPHLRPGTLFESVVCAGAAAEPFKTGEDLEEFVRRTIADRRQGRQTFERRCRPGRGSSSASAAWPAGASLASGRTSRR